MKHIDDKTFWADYQACKKAIYGLIRSSVKNDLEAEEIQDMIYDQIVKKRALYDANRASVFGFVKLLSKNALSDYFRKLRPEIVRGDDIIALAENQQVTQGHLRENQISESEKENEIRNKELPLANVKKQMLWITFNNQSPPHELIVFGSKLFLNEVPRLLVATHSSSPLREKQEQLEKRYIDNNFYVTKVSAVSDLDDSEVHVAFKELRRQMHQVLPEVLHAEKTRELYQSLFGKTVGETHLKEYYLKRKMEKKKVTIEQVSDPKKQSALITQWCDNVKRRVKKEAIRKGLLKQFLKSN